jgi:hypothetical protein
LKELEKIAKKKAISRNIVKEIINFGVCDNQKIDIIYELAITIEDNNKMKEICNLIKKFKIEINTDIKDDTINLNNKIILT